MEINDGTAVGAAATFGAAIVGVFVALWKNMTGRIAALDKTIAEKADKERVEALSQNLGAAFQNQREDAHRAADSRDKILDGIGQLSGVVNTLKYETGVKLESISSEMDANKVAREKLADSLAGQLSQQNASIDMRLTDIEAAIDGRNGKH